MFDDGKLNEIMDDADKQMENERKFQDFKKRMLKDKILSLAFFSMVNILLFTACSFSVLVISEKISPLNFIESACVSVLIFVFTRRASVKEMIFLFHEVMTLKFSKTEIEDFRFVTPIIRNGRL